MSNLGIRNNLHGGAVESNVSSSTGPAGSRGFARVLDGAKRRLCASRGFTLVETLATLAIVALITMAMSTGVAFATKQFTESVTVSEGKVLQSTLKASISNELAMVTSIEPSVGSQSGDSFEVSGFYPRTQGDVGAVMYGVNDGKITLAGNFIISKAAYTHGLQAEVTGVKYFKETGPTPAHFEVQLKIFRENGDELISDTFDVAPYNTVT